MAGAVVVTAPLEDSENTRKWNNEQNSNIRIGIQSMYVSNTMSEEFIVTHRVYL